MGFDSLARLCTPRVRKRCESHSLLHRVILRSPKEPRPGARVSLSSTPPLWHEKAVKLEQLVADLERPTAYSQGVDKVEVRETHASIVFLAGDFAYKVKKPVDFGFLDFSTLAQRERFCHREIALNSRLAPDVYLDVLPIVMCDGHARFGGPGDPIEFAVRMQRLPESATFAHLNQEGTLRRSEIRRLADRVAAFHRNATRSEEIAAAATFAVVERNAIDNLDALADSRPHQVFNDEVLDRLTHATRAELERRHDLIDARARALIPRDTHGDLRLDHVYRFPERTAPDDIQIIDCIEFNDRFRYADPIADAAFLAMDLRAAGEWTLADTFISDYVEASGDRDGQPLFPLYESYRAAVRAKVDLLRADQTSDQDAKERLHRRARAKVLLALGLLCPADERPCLVLVGGLPGTGKSVLARGLAQAANFVVLRSDVIRKELVGATEHESRRTDPGEGIYGEAWNERTRRELLQRAEEHVLRGRRVIIDATFKRDQDRRAFIDLGRQLHVPVQWILCCTDPTTARRRLQTRHGDASDADEHIYDHVAASWEPPSTAAEAICDRVDTTGDPSMVLDLAVARLVERRCASHDSPPRVAANQPHYDNMAR